MSYPWNVIGLIAIFTVLAISLVLVLSKYTKSRAMKKRLGELRSVILSKDGRYLGQVKQDRNGGHVGSLILPGGGELPILIWRIPVASTGDVSPGLIVEPVRLVKPETPGLISSGQETLSKGAQFLGSDIPSSSRAKAEYPSPSPPSRAAELIPKIPEDKWEELRDRLRQLKGFREFSTRRLNQAAETPRVGHVGRRDEMRPAWVRKRLLGIVNTRARLM